MKTIKISKAGGRAAYGEYNRIVTEASESPEGVVMSGGDRRCVYNAAARLGFRIRTVAKNENSYVVIVVDKVPKGAAKAKKPAKAKRKAGKVR